MKIEIRKEHPFTIVGLFAFGFILNQIIDLQRGVEVDLDQTVLFPLSLLLLIGVYLLQIRKTIIFEEGLFVFLQKKEKIEIKVSQIMSASRKGRLLRIELLEGKMEFDTGFASRKDIDSLIELIETRIKQEA